MSFVRKQAELDQNLLAAHETKCTARLAGAYSDAATRFEAAGDIDAAAFFRTHALVYALEDGLPDAARHEAWLRAHGRM